MAGMRYRKLRIMWSGLWIIVGVLMVALCVRSYRHADIVRDKSMRYEAISVHGELKVTRMRDPLPSLLSGGPTASIVKPTVQFESFPVDNSAFHSIQKHVRQFSNSSGFGFY